MKLFILLFLFIVVTCQAQLLLKKRLIARQGEPESDDAYLTDQYEKFDMLAKKYAISVDPDPQTLLVPAIYNTDHLRSRGQENRVNNPNNKKYSKLVPSRFTHPRVTFHTRSLIDEMNQIQEVTEAEQVEPNREARLARVDKDALSKLSKEDRKIIQSRLSLSERAALLDQLENGQLDHLLPREENRFGGFGLDMMGGLTNAASQLGATAGRYIGNKLAGTMGAKLGAAAGAYLGAAAASRFVKKPARQSNTLRFDEMSVSPQKSVNNGASYDFGAINV